MRDRHQAALGRVSDENRTQEPITELELRNILTAYGEGGVRLIRDQIDQARRKGNGTVAALVEQRLATAMRVLGVG